MAASGRERGATTQSYRALGALLAALAVTFPLEAQTGTVVPGQGHVCPFAGLKAYGLAIDRLIAHGNPHLITDRQRQLNGLIFITVAKDRLERFP